jgi:tetratricopeptide (TPR) repeat protein
MTKPVKIALAAVAAFFCLGCVCAAVVGYFAVSFYQAHRLFNEGVTAMGQQNYPTAILKFQSALGKNLEKTYRAFALGDLAFAEYEDGRCNDALHDYTEALKLNPNLAWAHEYRGWLYNESADTDAALKDYAEAIRLDPNSYYAHYNRGLIEIDRKDLEGAVEDFSEAVRIDPTSAIAYYNRGLAYSWQREYDRALANLDAAIQLDPRNPAALAERGYVYVQKQAFDKAVPDLTASIQLEPGHQGAYRLRGVAFRDQKHWSEALSDFNKALQLNPTDVATLEARASTYSQMGDQDHAIADFTTILQVWNLPEIYYRRGLAYSRKGDYDRAHFDLRTSVDQTPEDASALNNLAWFLATCPDAKFRNGNQAIGIAMKACTNSRWRNAYYLDTLAAAYAESGQFTEAVAYQVKAAGYENLEKSRVEEMAARRKLYEQNKPYRQLAGR